MVIKVDGMEFDTVEDVVKAKEAGLIQKHDVLGTSPDMQMPHGQAQNQNVGGLFTRPGAEQDMYHTIVQPTGGEFLSRLYRGTTVITDPEYDVLSGVKALVGSAPDDGCGPAPKAGVAKLCTLRSAFGEAYIETDQGQLNKMGGYLNRADMDRTLRNAIATNNAFLPEPLRSAGNINTPLGLAYMRLYTALLRELMRVLFTGNYGTKAGIFSREFNGFDQLIIENPTDVEGNICGAASSKVISFNNQPVGGSVNGVDLVEYISGLMHFMMRLSEDTGLPFAGEIAMPNDMFWVLTSVWPCSYLTNNCNVVNNDGQRVIVTGGEQAKMRDDMRTGNFLWVNGVRVPVVLTNAITQTAYGAGYSSSIYFIPTIALGEQVTYLEGFDQFNPAIRGFVEAGANTHYRAHNGGLYAMTERQSDFCIEHKFGIQPRLVMRTPWLAWRIENVNYTMPGYLYSRDWNPSGIYHKNGGRYYNDLPDYANGSI
jgi:hypothetical protein